MAAMMTIVAVMVMYLAVYYLVKFIAIRKWRRLQCPNLNEPYDVQTKWKLGEFWEPEEEVDVTACSHFADPERVICDKACLKKKEARAA